jgi:hypothetical protein
MKISSGDVDCDCDNGLHTFLKSSISSFFQPTASLSLMPALLPARVSAPILPSAFNDSVTHDSVTHANGMVRVQVAIAVARPTLL